MEHTQLIDRILEVERTARALSDEALERQAHLEQSLAAEKADITRRYMARSKARLEDLEQREQSKKEQALSAMNTRLSDTRRKMELTYARYGENWVDTLFHQVVDAQ